MRQIMDGLLALTLSQYQYTIEYRKTCNHSNANALSCLPVGPDASYDEEEDCTIKTVTLQLDPNGQGQKRGIK